jgi:two-component system, NtrC family, nitrogen regulation sensor histidine kinase GlnL
MTSSSNWLAFDHLISLIAVMNGKGAIQFANAALEQRLGASRKALRGTLLAAHLQDATLMQNALAGARANEFAAMRFDVVLKAAGAHDETACHAILSQTDDADRFVIELVELQTHARHEQQERLLDQTEANKELMRNLAHEIKNPLGGIRGAAQLVQMEVESRELQECAQVIIHEADRLQTLVDRWLAPHRVPHLITDVNIHEVLERVRSVVLAEYPKGLKVVRDYDASIPEFRGDREQLIQVVMNLAQNAAQAMRDERDAGTAQLILRTRIARQITIARQRYRLALELHVQDNGQGVSPELAERIFYPLVSGREGGSGLGLTLAQNFVHQHHGTIECDSNPGRCIFKVFIPLP